MSDENMPPWDINRPIQNPIDQKMVYTRQPDIFSMANFSQPTSKDSNIKKEITENKITTDLAQNTPTHNIQSQSQIKNIDNKNSPKAQTKETQALYDDSTNAIALALKYRPKTFAELVGQESVARTLCLALDSKKIANAYLFSGLRGSGKTSSARILARSLQCENGTTSNPCGNCPNCIAALKGAHLDIIELDGASNRKIDDIRDLIEQTHYKPTMGRFKVFIIDEVHMLTKEAFNSLLKTLEEPPSYVKFILATTDPLKVPPTILSRTQHFRFKKIPINALKNHLSHILQKENVLTDNESLDMIIRNGHGSVRDTLTLLDQAIVFCQGELTTQKLADMLGALDPKAFDVLFQALLSKNMQACIQFARSLEGYEIEMILDELSLYIKNKMLEEIPQIPPVLGMRYANIINDSKVMLQLDCDSEFCLLLTILKMLEAQKIREVAHAIKQLESMQINTEIAKLANDYIANPLQSSPHDDIKMQNDDKKIDSIQSTLEANNIQNNMQIDIVKESQLLQDYATNTYTNTLNENIIQNNIESKISKKENINKEDLDSLEVKQDSITENSANINAINNEVKDEKVVKTINTESMQQKTQNKQGIIQNNNNDHLFQSLTSKLYDRDYAIGNLFENKILYEKLENATIYLTFYLTQDELELLRQGYSGIMQVMREVYGDSIKMQVEKKNPQDIIMYKNTAINQENTENKANLQASENNNTNYTESKENEIRQDSINKDSSNINPKENNNECNTTQNTESMQTETSKDPAMNFISQNSDMVRSMKNELGIKEVKILSLDIL